MLIFDQLKRSDPQLRVIALVVLAGLGVLLGGLWWVQVVSARDYQASMETQSYRTVRIPAVRGKILDCNGVVLAENRPTYSVSLYLDELRKPFDAAYATAIKAKKAELEAKNAQVTRTAPPPSLGQWLASFFKKKRSSFVLTSKDKLALRQQARFLVASNVVWDVSSRLHQPMILNRTNFQRHYETRLALPLAFITNLDPTNIGRFAEQCNGSMGVDLEIQSTRSYPFGNMAAHVVGLLRRDDSSAEGEESYFSYRLPDFRGVIGVEYGYDKELRGVAGAKSVLVNNVGYRQTESVWANASAGHNVVLTLDTQVQQVAERALQNAKGAGTRGAVVVMDVHSGDILAMASAPPINPNIYLQGISQAEWQRINEAHAEKNRATFENYMPGSVFKTVVAMAALEAGWDPNQVIDVPSNPAQPGKGHIKVGGHTFKDTADAGKYDLRRALKLSSNTYFIKCGLWVGPEKILRLAQKLHFGERTGLPTHQDAPGTIPRPESVRDGWNDIRTGNISIGQDPVWVTPLQVAVLASAIANKGSVLWPRLVQRFESQDPTSTEPPRVFPSGQVREDLGLKEQTYVTLHNAMLADTEDPDGTGRTAAIPGLRICAKTGTAQVQNVHNEKIGQTVWFASFAPYEQPKYAVVVMVENGASGGGTCGPVAREIYTALLARDRRVPAQQLAAAH